MTSLSLCEGGQSNSSLVLSKRYCTSDREARETCPFVLQLRPFHLFEKKNKAREQSPTTTVATSLSRPSPRFQRLFIRSIVSRAFLPVFARRYSLLSLIRTSDRISSTNENAQQQAKRDKGTPWLFSGPLTQTLRQFSVPSPYKLTTKDKTSARESERESETATPLAQQKQSFDRRTNSVIVGGSLDEVGSKSLVLPFALSKISFRLASRSIALRFS